jgi:hypothetical protein
VGTVFAVPAPLTGKAEAFRILDGLFVLLMLTPCQIDGNGRGTNLYDNRKITSNSRESKKNTLSWLLICAFFVECVDLTPKNGDACGFLRRLEDVQLSAGR